MNSLLGALVIPASGTASNSLNVKGVRAITIMSPGTLDAGTYTLQCSMDDSTFYTLQSNLASPADLPVPAVNKAITYDLISYRFIRIAGPSAAAARTFVVGCQE